MGWPGSLERLLVMGLPNYLQPTLPATEAFLGYLQALALLSLLEQLRLSAFGGRGPQPLSAEGECARAPQ